MNKTQTAVMVRITPKARNKIKIKATQQNPAMSIIDYVDHISDNLDKIPKVNMK